MLFSSPFISPFFPHFPLKGCGYLLLISYGLLLRVWAGTALAERCHQNISLWPHSCLAQPDEY